MGRGFQPVCLKMLKDRSFRAMNKNKGIDAEIIWSTGDPVHSMNRHPSLWVDAFFSDFPDFDSVPRPI